MDMDNTVSAVKKYWPWALGGLALVFLASRLGGGTVDDGSGALTGSLYDPNLLANNLAMSQVAAGIQQAQIVADAQNNQAGWQTMQSGFQFATNANADFQAGQIAAYQATKEISVNAQSAIANVNAAGLLASSNTTAAFFDNLAKSNQSSASIVNSVTQSNAASQEGVVRIGQSMMMMYGGGGF